MRLDVAVHDGLVCRRRDTRGRLLDAIHRAAEGERAMREDGMLEVMSVDVIHHNEEAAAILAEVDGAHDMRAGEAGQQLELALEALDQLAFGGGLPAQHLDGIQAIGLEIAADVDGGHAATAALVDEFVAVLQHPPEHACPPSSAAASLTVAPAQTAGAACHIRSSRVPQRAPIIPMCAMQPQRLSTPLPWALLRRIWRAASQPAGCTANCRSTTV